MAERVRRFRCVPAARGLVDSITATFSAGYNDTLARRDTAAATKHVSGDEEEFLKPFYVEGASMALAVANAMPLVTASSTRAQLLERLPGYKHVIHAGWGFAHAVLPCGARVVRRAIEPADLFSALTLDGMAFARAFLFARPPWFDLAIPRTSVAAQRLWAQGYGRALWFLASANESIIERQRTRVGPELAAELDAGLGLATGFAGIAIQHCWPPPSDLARRPAYLQGLAFGLTARAMSTPQVFSDWLATLTPSEASDAKRLVSQCLIEPRKFTDCPVVVYTNWQHELRAELSRAWTIS